MLSRKKMNFRNKVLLFQKRITRSSDTAVMWLQRGVWGWLCTSSSRGLRGKEQSSSYWVTPSSSPMLTFPLIALHLSNHVKWACMLIPHSVHTHTHTHTHSSLNKKAKPVSVTAEHENTRALGSSFPWQKTTQNSLKVECIIFAAI